MSVFLKEYFMASYHNLTVTFHLSLSSFWHIFWVETLTYYLEKKKIKDSLFSWFLFLTIGTHNWKLEIMKCSIETISEYQFVSASDLVTQLSVMNIWRHVNQMNKCQKENEYEVKSMEQDSKFYVSNLNMSVIRSDLLCINWIRLYVCRWVWIYFFNNPMEN